MFDVYLRPKYTICPAKYTTDICCRYGNLIVLVFIVSQVIINNYYSKKDQDIMTASLHQILHYYLLTSIMPTAWNNHVLKLGHIKHSELLLLFFFNYQQPPPLALYFSEGSFSTSSGCICLPYMWVNWA